MNPLYICAPAVLIPSLITTVYGITVFLRKHNGLYYLMGVLAFMSLMTGQLAYCIGVFTGHSMHFGFHIEALGSIGSCLFFMTANLGPMDQLADDKSKQLHKYRVLASVSPLAAGAVFAFCVCMMKQRNCYTGITTGMIMTLLSMMPLYYCTKMAIIPDIEDGFVSCMRPYNLCVTVFELLTIFERGMRNLWLCKTTAETVGLYALYGAIGICTLAAMMFLKKGAKRWMEIMS